MDKVLFHKIAEDVAREWQYGGLVDTIYEEYAEEILARYLAAQRRKSGQRRQLPQTDTRYQQNQKQEK